MSGPAGASSNWQDVLTCCGRRQVEARTCSTTLNMTISASAWAAAIDTVDGHCWTAANQVQRMD